MKLIVKVLFFIFVVNMGWGADYVWDVAGGGNWGGYTNWLPVGVPGADDNVSTGGALTGILTVDSPRTVTNLTIDSGTVLMNHPLTITGTLTINSGTLNMNGNLLTLSNPPVLSGGELAINGGTISAAGIDVAMSSAGFTLSNAGAGAINCRDITVSAGTINVGAAVITATRNVTLNSGTFSDAQLVMSSGTLTSGGTIKSLQVTGGGSVSLSSALDVNGGGIDISNGTFSITGYAITGPAGVLNVALGSTLELHGTAAPEVTPGDFSGLVRYNNAGGGTVYNVNYTNLEIAGGAYTFSGGGATLSVGGNLTISSGSFSLNGSNGVIAGNIICSPTTNLTATGTEIITVSGSADFSGAAFTGASSTLNFTGTGGTTFNGGGNTFHNVTVAKSDAGDIHTINGAVTAANNFTLTNGTLDVNAALTVNNILALNGGTLNVNAQVTAGNQITVTNATANLIGADMTTNTGGQYSVRIFNGGRINVNDRTLTIGITANSGIQIEPGGMLTSGASGNIISTRSFRNGGTFTHGDGSVTLSLITPEVGNYAIVSAQPFYNLTINRDIQGRYNFLEDATNVTVDNDLAITRGELRVYTSTPFAKTLTAKNIIIGSDGMLTTMAGSVVNISGNFDNSNGGIVNATGSTFNFTDNSITSEIKGSTTFNNVSCTTAGKTIEITGSNTYNNLTITSAGVAQTVTVTDGTNQTVGGLLTLKGNSGNLLTLQSSTPGSAFTITDNGTEDVEFVKVIDSEAVNSISAVTSRNETPLTNINWAFGVNTITWTGAASTSWNVGTNWNLGYVPNHTDNIVIANAGFQPAAMVEETITNDLTINADANLDTAGFDLTTAAFVNNGTLRVRGGEALPANLNQGSVNYYHTVDNNLHSIAYNNLIISGTGTYSTTALTTVNGDLTVSNGQLDVTAGGINITGNAALSGGALNASSATVRVGGNWNNTATAFTSTGSIVEFTGGGAVQSVNGQSFNNVTVSGGTRTVGVNFTAAGDFFITGGDFQPGANTIIVGGDWNRSGGDFTPGTSTINFNNTGTIVNEETFYDLTISGGTRDQSNTVTVTNDMAINGGNYSPGARQINVKRDWNRSAGTFTNTGSTVIFTGDGNIANAETFNNMSVTGGTRTLTATPVTVDGTYTQSANITLGANTLDINASPTLTSGIMSISTGKVDFQDAGDINITSSTITLTGAGTIDATGRSFTVSGSGSVTLNAGTLLCADFTQSGGTVTGNTGTITASGNVTITAGTFNADTSTIVMTGAGTELRSNPNLRNLTINGGTVTQHTDIILNGNYRLQSGTYTQNSLALTVGGTFTLDNTTTYTAHNLAVAGNFTLNNVSTFNKGGTLTFNNNGELADNNVTKQDIGVVVLATAGTRTATTDILMTTLTVNAGRTFATGNNNITVTGNISVNATGTINASGQTTAGRAINAGGDVTFGQYTHGTQSVLNFSGSVDQAFTPNSSTFRYITINNTAGRVTMTGTATADTLTVNADGIFRIDSTSAAAALNINNANGAADDLIINADGTIELHGGNSDCTLSLADGASLQNSGTLTITANGTGQTRLSAAAGTAIYKGNNITFNNLKLLMSRIDYQRELILSGTAKIELYGVNCSFTGITINDTSEFIDGGQTFNLSGNWTNTTNGIATLTGTVNFTGTGTKEITSARSPADSYTADTDKDFNNINHTGSGTVQLMDDMYVKGTFTNSNNFNMNSNNLAVSGNMTLNAGSTWSTGATPGVLYFNGTSSYTDSTVGTGTNIGNIEIVTGRSLALSTKIKTNTITIAGTGTFTDNGNTVNILGNWINNSNGIAVLTGTIDFQGTANQEITAGGVTGNHDFFNLNHSTAHSLIQNDALVVSGAFNQTAGTFNQNDNQLTVAGNFTLANGTVFNKGATGSESLTFNGTTNLTDSTAGLQDLGKIVVDGTVTQLTDAKMSSLTIENAHVWNTGDFNLTVNGTISNDGTINASGQADGKVINITGNFDCTYGDGGTYTKGNGTVTFSGGVEQNLYPNGQDFGKVITATAGTNLKNNGNATFGVTTIVSDTTLSLQSGILILNGVLTVPGTLTVSGDINGTALDCNENVDFSGGTLNGYNGGNETVLIFDKNLTFTDTSSLNQYNDIIRFNGTGNFNSGNLNYSFNNIELTASANVTLITNDLRVSGNITNSGTLNTGSVDIYVQGNFTNSGTFTAGSQTLYLTGNVDTQTINPGASTLNNLTINKTANTNTVTLPNSASNLTINRVLTITQGIFIQNRNLIMSNTANLTDVIDVAANGEWRNITGTTNCTITLGGNASTGLVNNLGLINFDGGASKNLQIRSSVAGRQRDWKGDGTFTVGNIDVQDQTRLTGTPTEILCADGKPGVDSGNNINWFLGERKISGILYTDKGVTAGGANIDLNLYIYRTATTTRSQFRTNTTAGGNFTFDKLSYTDNDIVLLRDNIGTTVTVTGNTDILDFNLYQNNVIARNDNSSETTNQTFSNIAGVLPVLDNNHVKYEVTGGDITINNNIGLIIWTGCTYNPGGNVTLQGTGGVDVNGTLTDASNTITVPGNWTTSGTGVLNLTGTNTVVFNGAAQDINSGGTAANKEFNRLTHSGTGSLRLVTNSLVVNGIFTNSTNNFNMNNLNLTLRNNFTISAGTFTKGTGTIYFDGTTTFTDSTGTQNIGNIQINTGKSLTLATTMTTDDSTINGTLTDAGNTINIYGDYNNTNGSVTLTGLTDFKGTTTVTTGGDGAAKQFNNFTHSGNAQLNLSGDLYVKWDFTNSAGTFVQGTNNSITVLRHFTIGNGTVFTKDAGTGVINFSGTTTQTLTDSRATVADIGNVVINGTNNTLSCATNIVLNKITMATAGTIFDIDGKTVTFGASPTLTNGTIYIKTGTISATGIAVDVAGTSVNQDNTGGTINCGNFTVSGGVMNNTSNPVTVNCANFTVSGGTYNALSGTTINPTGNVTISGTNTFSRGTSTITMTGTGTINANQEIYNLHINPASAQTVTITTNNLNIQGTLETNSNGTLNFAESSNVTLYIEGNTTNRGNIDGSNTTGLITFNGILDSTVSGSITSSRGGILCNNTASFTNGTLNGHAAADINPSLIFNTDLTLGTFNHNNDKLVIRGGTFTTNNQDLYNADFTTGAVTVTGVLNIQKDMTLSADAVVTPDSEVNVWGILTIPADCNLNIQAHPLNIGHDGVAPSGLTISGNGMLTLSNGQVTTFTGNQNQNINITQGLYRNIVINKSPLSSVTFTNSSVDVTLDETLTVTSGIFIQNKTITTTGTVTIGATGEWRNIADNSDANIILNNILTINAGGKWTVTASENQKNVTLANTVTNAGEVVFTGHATTKNIYIASSSPGTQRDWKGDGIFTMNNVSVRDQTRTDPTPLYITHDGTSPGIDMGNNINWRIGDRIISGVLYSDKGITPVAGEVIRLVINRQSYTRKSFFDSEPTDADGRYEFTNICLSANDLILGYVKQPSPGTHVANTTTRVAGTETSITDYDFYKNHLIVRGEPGVSVGDRLSNSLMGIAGDGIADTLYSVVSDHITLNNNIEFLVWSSGTYVSGGNILTQGTGGLDVRGNLTADGTITCSGSGGIDISGTLTVGGNVTCSGVGGVNISGTFNAGSYDIFLGGNWIKESSGVFNYDTSRVIITGTLTSVISAGEIFYNLTINKAWLSNTVTPAGGLTVKNDLVVTRGTFDTDAGDMSIENDLTINGASGDFTPGDSYVYIHGNWTRSAGAFTPATSSVVFISDKDTTITGETEFNRLLFRKGLGNIYIATNITSNYLGMYRGLVIYNGDYTTTINGDLAIVGSGLIDSDAADNWGGPQEFVDDSSNYPSDFNASVNFNGRNVTVIVSGDFYVNGADMISSAKWYLIVPDNDDDVRKARAYGLMDVSWSDANYWVSASGGTIDGVIPSQRPQDRNNNIKWDFGVIDVVELYTVSDHVIFIRFGTPVENDNNEVSEAFTNGSVRFNNKTLSFEGTYTDIECTISTDGAGDIDRFYIKADTTWNTDADGLSAGSSTSTDRAGIHRGLTVDIFFDEDSVVRRNTKTRMPSQVVNALDHCPPVLISAALSDNITRNNLPAVYKFNAVELKFSEPIMNSSFISTADFISDADGDISDGGIGGAINTAGVVSGWGSFENGGNVVTHSGSVGPDNANKIFSNADRTSFTVLLGANYEAGGAIRSTDGTLLTAPSGIFTAIDTLRDNSSNNNFIDNSVTRTVTGNWTLVDIPVFTETKTDERDSHINGRIDNYKLKFNVPVQIYDAVVTSAGFSNHTIEAVNFTHSYQAEETNLNRTVHPVSEYFNLNLIEIPLSYNHGDTGELPVIVYNNTSNVKFISVNHRLEMGNNHSNMSVRVDGANPVIYGIDLSIDDPDEYFEPAGFNSSPYYDHISESYLDPGAAPDFDMHRNTGSTTVSFTERTYRNKIRFTFSEDIDLDVIGIPLNSQAEGYLFGDSQKSEFTDNNFGNTQVVSDRLYVSGLGTLNDCNLSSDTGTNFVQFETERELHIHITGWFNGLTFPGAVNSVTKVPRSAGVHAFNTALGGLNDKVKDFSGNSLRSKDKGGSEIGITVSKDWDVSSPVFRYIAATSTYAGDPLAGGSDVSSGVSGGNPVDNIEFIMNKAILDLPEETDMSRVFKLNFIGNNAEPYTPPLFTTGIVKLGKWTNNMETQSDTDSNDQAFALKFESDKPDYIRIKWSYNPTPDLYITDLRGNRLRSVTERITIETAPPFILDTRAVVGSDKIYVEFNENVYSASGGNILPSDFQVTSDDGILITEIKPYDSEAGLKDKFIFKFDRSLTQDNIASDLFTARTEAVKDSLDNTMRDDINYQLSSIGINFFFNTGMEDFYRKGDAWIVKNFDGTEKITPDSLRITAVVDIEKYRGMTPILYYDIFEKRDDADFWFPNKNISARQIVGRSLGNNKWEFLLPANDPKIKIGSYMAIVFKIGDFYSYRSIHSVESKDFSPRDAETYMVKIERFQEQRGGVTVLNNIINPVKGEIVKLSYKLEKAGPVSIVVYDLAGNVVKDLTTEFRAAGEHLVEWNGRNNNGKIVARGVYLMRVRAPGIFNQIRKVLVVK